MKSTVYGIRLTEKQRKVIEDKAQAMGLTVASYLRHLALTAKKKADHQRVAPGETAS